MKLRLLAALAITTLPATTALAQEPKFALSAGGPGAGQSAGAIGAGVDVLTGGLILPMLTMDYAYGVSPALDLFLSVDLGFNVDGDFALFGIVEPGVTFRFTPPGAFDAGVKLGPEVLFLAVPGEGGGALFLFGATPGIVLGGNTGGFQASVGLDVPLYFAATGITSSGSGSDSGFAAALRPYAVAEFVLTPSLNLFIKGEAELILSNSIGFLYGGTQIGVSF